MEFAIVALLVVYLVPWMFAVANDHEHQAAILTANLLLGWTGLGWLAVCAWAIASDPHPSQHHPPPDLQLLDGSSCWRRSDPPTRPKMVLVRSDR